MTAVPNGDGQKWHSDNRARGLTIIVPLVDFTAANGATQVLVGSHNSTWNLVAQQGAQVVEASTGSLAAYDSRTYHRGLGNRTKEGRVGRCDSNPHRSWIQASTPCLTSPVWSPQPALIFCYDRKETPPPGCGMLESRAHATLAGLLNIVSAGWITCASSWNARQHDG
jgi:hypothetical protein